MQYTKSTLNNVKDLDIVDIISKFLTLKRQGANYLTSCPFHDEKSPSFLISPSKQIYKCFGGCDAGGDGIQFVMEYEKISFVEAIEKIANLFGIPLEYEHFTDEELQFFKKEREEKAILENALNFCRDFFEQHSPLSYLTERHFSDETITKFQLGFAPKGNLLLQMLQQKGKELSVFEQIGVIKKGENGYYDVFQNRIMIPIQDKNGAVIAFTGRNIEQHSIYPKYFNSSELVYQKGHHLFGLNHAKKSIQKEGFVYLVEGNMDVIQLHNKGIFHAVAQGGTALTQEQIELLKKQTSKVCIIADNDTAGIEALQKNARLLLKNNLFVSVIIPTKKDVDEEIRTFSTQELLKWQEKKTDFISEYLLAQCIQKSKESPTELVFQVQKLGETIELIQTETFRQVYYDTCKTHWKEFGKNYKLKKAKHQKEEAPISHAILEKGGCYVALEKEGKEVPISNFTMEVLFFIEDNNEPKYFVKIRHKKGLEKFATVSTDDFTTVNTFAKAIERKGNFFFTGTLKQLYQLKEKYIFGVGRAYQHNVLGQFKEYFVWANGILYNNHFFKADRHGIVKIKRTVQSIEDFEGLEGGIQVIIEEKEMVLNSAFDILVEYGEEKMSALIAQKQVHYLDFAFLPASSKTIVNREEQDQYTEMRKFSHNPISTLTFFEWAKLMDKSYVKENGKIGVAFYVMSLFRDMIFEYNNNWTPLLFAFGLPQKGKSKFAESIASMFGKPMEDGINLEGGSTTTGIRRFMASRKNALVWLNEYKNDLPITTIGMLKSLADGSGKLQGVKTAGTETNHYKPHSSAIICGQDLPTKDPALLSRCILNEFDGTFGDYDAYELLKEYEHSQATTQVTCELLKYRKVIQKHYKNYFKIISKQLKSYCQKEQLEFEDRTFLNLGSLLVPMAILMEETDLKFPFEYGELANALLERVLFQESIRRTADEVEQFFTTLMSLINKEIYHDRDFKISAEVEDNKRILFIRLKRVHSFYLTQCKKQGTTGYHLGVIKSYLEKHKSYLGVSKSVRFGRTVTTAMAFDYEYLSANELEFDFE